MTPAADAASRLSIQTLGRVAYAPTYAAMRAFTAQRTPGTPGTPDALWLCEHEPVYTLGLAGNLAHVLNPGSIPVLQTDRGGQVTYHGPGQVVAYPLLDLRRAGYFIKEYVFRIEEAVIKTLAHFGVTGHRVRGAPGIYVRLDEPASHARLPPDFSAQQLSQAAGADRATTDYRLGKIAALGIKLSRHCTTHGVALNVAMDLAPFSRINPCGYAGLQTTDLSTIGVDCTWDDAAQVLGQKLATYLHP